MTTRWLSPMVGMAFIVGLDAAGEQDGQDARELEPERIDVVFSRLARQDRALEALLEIMKKLEFVAEHPNAAAALLSDEGEPTDRLRSALAEVAKRRNRPMDPSAQPAVVAARTQTTEELQPEIVYAQMSPGGTRRVLIAARGAKFQAAVGRSIRLRDDTIDVLAIRRGADGGVDVELSVNGGAPFVRRVGW